jgi:tetratricopeptide (TPR) repeat protein
MDQQEYHELYRQIAAAGESGNWNHVIRLSRAIAESNLPGQDRIMAWVNCATAYGKLNDLTNALSCFDQAAAVSGESSSAFVIEGKAQNLSLFVLEAKAHFLAEHSRPSESLAVYREILDHMELDSEDRAHISDNIAALAGLNRKQVEPDEGTTDAPTRQHRPLIELMEEAIATMDGFPSIDVQARFGRQLIQSWPPNTTGLFTELSLLVADAVRDAAKGCKISSKALGAEAIGDSVGSSLSDVTYADVFGMPFGQTLEALLGRGCNALFWEGRLLPRDFSRDKWYRLRQIKAQVGIEYELQQLSHCRFDETKSVVAALWTLVALATHMHPDIFVSEGALHLSSVSGGGATFSMGANTDTIMEIASSSMPVVVGLLREALKATEIDACDMMWMAAGLSRVAQHSSGWSEPEDWKEFDIFLSHRGTDVKAELMKAVLNLDVRHRVFLDCLSLPHGLVNRHFVFRSLGHSHTVVVIDSENFSDSEWCRKELWMSKVLHRLSGIEFVRVQGSDAAFQLLSQRKKEGGWAAKRPTETERPNDSAGDPDKKTSWITNRILNNIDYWARTPNLYSARKKGLRTESVEKVLEWLQPDLGLTCTNLAPLRSEIVLRLTTMFKDLTNEFHSRLQEQTSRFRESMVETTDLWAAAVQVIVGALSLRTNSYSKIETRRYIDAANQIVEQLGGLLSSDPGARAEQFPTYLTIVGGAVALDLAAEDRKSVCAIGLAQLLEESAQVREGLILLDARQPGIERDFLLRLVLLLVWNDVGSVGLIQDGNAPVHNKKIDGKSLEILPCVTIYPGMESVFAH